MASLTEGSTLPAPLLAPLPVVGSPTVHNFQWHPDPPSAYRHQRLLTSQRPPSTRGPTRQAPKRSSIRYPQHRPGSTMCPPDPPPLTFNIPPPSRPQVLPMHPS
ncbi:hypothetical protein EJ06DRAFT_523869 [Trichodelitschia bisporula]|uniref:Uncharacterized protein n=1 Tax=Trichodelitschia bisporula TaxID=703511 RepID=A0A6G1HNR2_9PEZI|nr:hypothetical protein EJ06DRAFT_523869 [Trichodelitschia bisporula]